MVKGKHIPCTYDNCELEFTSKRALNAHIVEIHCDYDIFECEICHQSLKSRQSMKEHMNTHTGNKPYSCPTCGERFKHASQVSVHKRVHRTPEENRELAAIRRKKRVKNQVSLPYTILPEIDFGEAPNN